MKLKYKLTLAFLLVTLIPILLITGVSTWHEWRALRTEIGIEITTLARSKAEAIALILQGRVTEARILAETPEVQHAVRRANAGYEGRDEDAIRAQIHRDDETWIDEKKAGGSALARSILAAPLSQRLAAYQARDTARYGEIFLTDRRGAAVAMTKLLSDYDQADEGWWRSSFADGEGAVFIDDRGFDETVGALAMGVVVPVKDDDIVVGVLKVNFKVRDVLDVVSVGETDRHRKITLVRELGSVIAQSSNGDVGLTSEEEEALSRGAWGTTSHQHGEEWFITGYSPVEMDISVRVPNPGERKGIAGERWVSSRWWIFIEISHEVAFEPVTRSLWLSLGGLLLALLCAVLLALVVARTISSPILRLHEGTEIIGRGDRTHRVGTDARDEVGQLSRAFDDMVERIQAVTASRDELDRMRRDLERSNEELKQFAYVASHDLQEPLRKVTSFVQLLAKRCEGQLDEEAQEYIGFAVDGARRMKQLIEDLLAYSRAGSGAENPEPVDCEAALDDVLANLSQVIEESGARVSRGPLPTVLAAPMPTQQLLQNLLSNALKYRGEAAPEIHVSATREAAAWRFTVRDNGIGIAPEHAERIFVIFQRLHGIGEYAGTGIGLAVCRRIVERFDGRIWVESAAGEGAAFHFTLPDKKWSGTDAS